MHKRKVYQLKMSNPNQKVVNSLHEKQNKVRNQRTKFKKQCSLQFISSKNKNLKINSKLTNFSIRSLRINLVKIKFNKARAAICKIARLEDGQARHKR